MSWHKMESERLDGALKERTRDESRPTKQGLVVLFESLLNLIKQADDQLTLASQYHFTVIGSLIPIIASL